MTIKIVLGTAQFGLDYGISNTTGVINSNSIDDILCLAQKHNIDVIDTAAGYGSAETVLGLNDLSKFQIITKSNILNKNGSTDHTLILHNIHRSLKRLKIRKLSGFLLHQAHALRTEAAPKIYQSMINAKTMGLVEKIGYSVYQPEDLNAYFDKFPPDMVQLPANAFDQRFKNSGWLDKLDANGVEVHIRSIFLQGLLLMQPINIPTYFTPWREHIAEWHEYCRTNFNSPLEACLAPFKKTGRQCCLVVGVQSSQQLQEIISVVSINSNRTLKDFCNSDVKLIDPSMWQLSP